MSNVDVDNTLGLDKLGRLASFIMPKLLELDSSIGKTFNLSWLFKTMMEILPVTLQSTSQMQRSNSDQEYVMVCGPTGAGKSALSAEMLGHELVLKQKKSSLVLDYPDQEKKIY